MNQRKKNYLVSEFQNNLKHNGSRYEVKLSFIGENKTLPGNYLLAKTRTGNLLKQLAKERLVKKLRHYFQRILTRGNDRKSF